jgi:hypothetical protein
MTGPVHYCPPEPEKLDRLARDVCREMGLDQRARGIAYELAGFMKVIARARAKDLNRQQDDRLDNEHKTA